MWTSHLIALRSLGQALANEANGTSCVLVRVRAIYRLRYFHDPTRQPDLALELAQNGEGRPCVVRVADDEIRLLEEPVVNGTVVVYTLRAPPVMLAGCSSLKTE